MHTVQTRCLLALSYSISEIESGVIRYPLAAYTTDTLENVAKLIEKIDNIDNELDSNLSDSMAVAVADIRLDYKQYTYQQLANRARLVGRLSDLIGLPVNPLKTSQSSQSVYRAAY